MTTVAGRSRLPDIIAGALLCLFSAALYLGTMDNEFIVDDNLVILKNEWIKDPGYIPLIFASPVWSFLPADMAEQESKGLYRPLMHIYYMLAYRLSGLDPWGYHAVNILFHALGSVAVFLCAREILGRTWPRDAKDMATLCGAALAGLIFSAHPVHVEAVAWVSNAAEVSSVALFAYSLYLYVRNRYMWSASVFLLAALSKETALTLPLLILAYDVSIAGAPIGMRLFNRTRHLPFVMVCAAYFALRAYALDGFASSASVPKELSMSEYLMNIPMLLATHVWKLLVPTDLVFYVYLAIEPALPAFGPKNIMAAAALATLVAAVFLLRKRMPVVFFSLSMVFIPFLPLLYFGWMRGGYLYYSDRFLYLPSIGFSILVPALGLTYLGSMTAKGPAARRLLIASSVLLTALYSTGTVKRAAVWQSEYTLWKDTAKKAPEFMLGRFSYGIEASKRGLLDEALAEFTALTLAYDDNPTFHYNRAVVLAKKGLMDEAVAGFEEALSLNPDYRQAREGLERAKAIRGNKGGR